MRVSARPARLRRQASHSPSGLIETYLTRRANPSDQLATNLLWPEPPVQHRRAAAHTACTSELSPKIKEFGGGMVNDR
ncbi:MAG TPA: hypothetical protein VGU01_16050 [Sphingomicrobium sp.]|nr:hypothetical protein [Sphingomicrobium sp.]